MENDTNEERVHISLGDKELRKAQHRHTGACQRCDRPNQWLALWVFDKSEGKKWP